jgi:hypothetical protein
LKTWLDIFVSFLSARVFIWPTRRIFFRKFGFHYNGTKKRKKKFAIDWDSPK